MRFVEDEESKQQYKKFLEGNERCNFQQSLEWAEVKKPNWKPEVILAEDEDKNIIGSLCVWIRKMPIFGNIMYASRGPVCDIHDIAVLKQLTDGAKELAKKASVLLGKEVIVSTFEELELKEKFHGIWACASLLHIKREDLKTVLNNLYNNLDDNGVFYMSFKYGEKEYVDDKNRYFNCFTDESIISFINENTKYNILGLYITEDKLGRVNEVKWVNLICNKKSV